MAVVHSLASDMRERVYVTDRQNHRIKVFSPDGKNLWEVSEDIPESGSEPWAKHASAITYDSFLDVIYSIEGNWIRVRDMHLKIVEEFPAEQWQWPHDIDVYQNTVYVAG